MNFVGRGMIPNSKYKLVCRLYIFKFRLKLDLYGSEYWSKDRREKLLDSVKQMRQVVKQANVSVVEKKLNKLKRSKSVTVRKIDKQKCKIGRTTYKYTYIAY
jgi:hypothetical protein